MDIRARTGTGSQYDSPFQNEKLVPVMEDLFYQLIEQLIDMNEVSYTNVFVDGKKLKPMQINIPSCGQRQLRRI